MFSDGARSESRAFGRRGGRPSRGGKCGHRDDVPPTEMQSLLCSFGLPPTHFIRYPDGGAQKHLRTVVLRQPSSLFLHLPRGPPVQSPFASLRANLRFFTLPRGLTSSSVTLRFAQGKPSVYHLRTVVLRHPSPPLNTSGDTDYALFGGGSRRLPWRPSRTPSAGR